MRSINLSYLYRTMLLLVVVIALTLPLSWADDDDDEFFDENEWGVARILLSPQHIGLDGTMSEEEQGEIAETALHDLLDDYIDSGHVRLSKKFGMLRWHTATIVFMDEEAFEEISEMKPLVQEIKMIGREGEVTVIPPK